MSNLNASREVREHCNATLQYYVYNLTSSYANQSNEATMVATSVIMFLLAALFFNLNLFSRFSDISTILNPSVRFFLSTSLSLFLPVMSYLFSEAKDECIANAGEKTELSLRARTILMWMLLVELLRKKVEAILVSAGVQGYTSTIERATRIAWLGYLVFYNLRSAGKKALYGIIWVLAVAKLVQRFVTLELGKRSFAYGNNPQLLASYMPKMLQQEQHASDNGLLGSERLKQCKYVVMGEEDLEKNAGPDGYDLQLTEAIVDPDSSVVTIGKIWTRAETDELLRRDPSLKRLCLSFALYKLLRRRLEDFPITSAEAHNCHGLIFKGLCNEEGTDGEATAAVALFQVFNDEVQFLCEYYHSVQPVVLASPFFFLVNYIIFPIVVWIFCVLTIILCSNGDVLYAFHSFSADNYGITIGIMSMIGCILSRVTKSPQYLFSTVDISISILLFLTFFYEEVVEFIVFLLSNWFMVSLLCSYISKPRWRESPLLRGILCRILWMRNNLSHPDICVKQFSLLWFCRLSPVLPTKAVPIEAKKAIMDRLKSVSDDAPLSKGIVRSASLQSSELLWACESASIAEVILTWHIATTLLEKRHPLPKKTKTGTDRKMATVLSRYCAYLVAFHPELLPDDKNGTERVYKDMKKELKEEMGCMGYYCSGQDAQFGKLMEVAGREQGATTALCKGARLGKNLIDIHKTAADDVWKQLAGQWTEVVVHAAPTGSELHVKAHKEALALGGEFITVLWALATHTGIARGPVVAPRE